MDRGIDGESPEENLTQGQRHFDKNSENMGQEKLVFSCLYRIQIYYNKV